MRKPPHPATGRKPTGAAKLPRKVAPARRQAAPAPPQSPSVVYLNKLLRAIESAKESSIFPPQATESAILSVRMSIPMALAAYAMDPDPEVRRLCGLVATNTKNLSRHALARLSISIPKIQY